MLVLLSPRSSKLIHQRVVPVTAIIADSKAAGGDNRNWRRRSLSVGLFVAGAALGAFLLKFGALWPLLVTSLLFTIAMVPLLLGKSQAGVA